MIASSSIQSTFAFFFTRIQDRPRPWLIVRRPLRADEMVAVVVASASPSSPAPAPGSWAALLPVLLLLPASQVASFWILLLSRPALTHSSTPQQHLYRGLALVSAFFASWTVFKKLFQGDKSDLGHVTMGFLCAMSLWRRPKLTATATIVVFLHYTLALYLVFVQFSSASALAKAVKKSTSTAAIVWAWTLRAYVVSNLVLWYQVLTTKVWPLLVQGYESVPAE
jgi:hypothetical protein